MNFIMALWYSRWNNNIFIEHSVIEINHAVHSTVGGVSVEICDSLHKPKHSKLPPAQD